MRNFASYIESAVRENPDRMALHLPEKESPTGGYHWERLTFGDLWNRVSSYIVQLKSAGIRRDHRVVVLLPLSADLYAVVLALMAMGATTVLLDPGYSRRQAVRCIKHVRPQALVATRSILKYRFFLPFFWRVPIKMGLRYEGPGLDLLTPDANASPSRPVQPGREQPALITFTSGTTGSPKGALRTHETLIHQHRAIKETFPPFRGEVNLTCFPVVVLHYLCSGTPTVLPAPSFEEIGGLDPRQVVRQIESESVSALSGNPAFFRSITSYCRKRDTPLPGIQRVAVGGAPVDMRLCGAILRTFPRADAHIVYGSTEAEPVAFLSVKEAAGLDETHSYCYGYPAGYIHPATRAEIIQPHHGPIKLEGGQLLSDWKVPGDAWGELIVSGKHVVRSYFDHPKADAANKIRDENGCVWHRMGDIVRRDRENRLWIGGRLPQLIERGGEYILPFLWQLRFDRLEGVEKSVLHEVDGKVYLVIACAEFTEELRAAVEHLIDRYDLPVDHILSWATVPVESRHQSKIDYTALEARIRAHRV